MNKTTEIHTLPLDCDVHNGPCDICKEEKITKCREEHPEWFTKRGSTLKNKFRAEFLKATEISFRYCIQYSNEGFNEFSICGEHLKKISIDLIELDNDRHREI